MEKITLNYSASGQKLKPLYSLKKFASDTVNYVVAVFDLDESWAFDSVRAVWKTENACISTVLDQDGTCTVPQEVLQKKAKVEVNLVGSDVEENQLTDRLTTYPVQAFIVDRDVPICGSETAEITPSQFEQFVQIVTAEVAKIRDVDRVELNDDYTITFYYSDGTESPKIGPIRGETGADGNGIQNITKIGSEGRIDTYRIIYTNGGHFDFNVTNGEKGDRGVQGETGNGIDRIEKTGTVGSVDTYTIYFTDGTTTTFNVTNGEVTNAQLTAVVTDLKEDLGGVIYDSDGYKKLNNPTVFADGSSYTGSVGNNIIVTKTSSSLAFNPIDLSDYVGTVVTVYFDTTATSSNREIALCNSDGLISAFYYEKNMTDAGFVFNITETNKYLYLSVHKYLTSNIRIWVYNSSALLPSNIKDVSKIKSDLGHKHFLDPADFELGNIVMTNSGWTYTASNSRIRTCENVTYHLSKDDVIGLNNYSGVAYYVGYKDSEDAYYYTDALTNDFTAPLDGDYVVCIALNPAGAITDLNGMINSIFGLDNTVGYSNTDILKTLSDNQMLGVIEYNGYISATNTITTPTEKGEVYTEKIPVHPEDILHLSLTYTTPVDVWIAIAKYDANGKFISRDSLYDVASIKSMAKTYIIQNGVYFIAITYRTYGEEPLKIRINNITETLKRFIQKQTIDLDPVKNLFNTNVKSINHRGFNTVAPENTLPAFILSRRKGFNIVETDVRYTEDNIAVCLHDASINRTARYSNGDELTNTVNISDITYSQALTYDFGIWKNQNYAGTKIPTLKEFMQLCHNIGLKPYVEIKGNMTTSQITNLVDIANECGMSRHTTWICADITVLQQVLNYNQNAKVGYVVNSITNSVIADVNLLNDDAIINSGSYTSNEIALCKVNNTPLEIWVVNNQNTIRNLDPYITGVTSDNVIAGWEIYSNSIVE